LSIVMLVAFEEFQESVVDWPFSMAEGDALREMVGAGADGVAGAGGASVVVAAGGGAGAFFAQPAPEMIKVSRMIAAAASEYLLIAVSPIPCLWFLRRLTAVLPDTQFLRSTGVYHADG
jgi:hypothetical protein